MNLHDPQTLTLLQQAAEWRLLSLLLSAPDAEWAEQMAALAAEVSDDALRQAASAASDEADLALYHTIFGPGGPAAPREVSYQQAAISGRFLAEVLDFYAAFAYHSQTGEPPDHVATEADFIGYLRMKEAYARSRGDQEQATVAAQAAQQFMADHLSAIASSLAKSLAASGIRYLALASAALQQRAGPRAVRGSPDPALDSAGS